MRAVVLSLVCGTWLYADVLATYAKVNLDIDRVDGKADIFNLKIGNSHQRSLNFRYIKRTNSIDNKEIATLFKYSFLYHDESQLGPVYDAAVVSVASDEVAFVDGAKAYSLAMGTQEVSWMQSYIVFDSLKLTQSRLRVATPLAFDALKAHVGIDAFYSTVLGSGPARFVELKSDYYWAKVWAKASYENLFVAANYQQGDRAFSVFDSGLSFEHCPKSFSSSWGLKMGYRYSGAVVSLFVANKKASDLVTNKEVTMKIVGASLGYRF